jgi:hypothetical protein
VSEAWGGDLKRLKRGARRELGGIASVFDTRGSVLESRVGTMHTYLLSQKEGKSTSLSRANLMGMIVP